MGKGAGKCGKGHFPHKMCIRDRYENIIDEEKGVYNEDGSLNLNPNSLIVKECYLEPSLKEAAPYESFQFVRQGFFCADYKDSKPGAPVFNRIVSLKSSFKLPKHLRTSFKFHLPRQDLAPVPSCKFQLNFPIFISGFHHLPL